MTERQKEELLELLWDCMRRSPDHPDRVVTGWGTKTQEGLIASIERIMDNKE